MNMNPYRLLTFIAAVVLSTAASAATQYTATPLGLLPGGHFLDASAINDSGEVTGYGYSDGTNLGFFWQQGQLSSLGTLPGSTTSGGYDINNAGTIAGSSGSDAFIWQNGQMSMLPRATGASWANANAINASGQVAGSSGTPPTSSAAVWTNGQIALLPGLVGQPHSVATGINANGVIVGISYSESYNASAVTWQNGQAVQLSSGPFSHAGATDINNGGAIAGFVDVGGNRSQAARWDNGQITLLDNLAGIQDARAYAINNDGVVVGSSFGSGTSVATIWEGSNAQSLQGLLVNGEGWELRQAQDINASGQIVGWGSLNGQAQSFVLTPVPEGASAAYMLVGLMGLAAARRRKEQSAKDC
ncbi:MAG: hypothetical protein Q7U28_01455 [Aquabacterium sp.]|nr:hypothetical protein [Aquabacterium sp.]